MTRCIIKRYKYKKYVIEKIEYRLSNGKKVFGYQVIVLHPDQKHIITKTTNSFREAQKIGRSWTK